VDFENMDYICGEEKWRLIWMRQKLSKIGQKLIKNFLAIIIFEKFLVIRGNFCLKNKRRRRDNQLVEFTLNILCFLRSQNH